MADDLAWERLDARTAYACEGFEIVREDVRLPDGTETAFDYLTEEDSVVVLPLTTDGDVVVIEEWRQAVERANRGLPAGGLEPGDEDLAAAARRELAEETGYEAGSVERLVSAEPANGFADATFHYFLARDCTPTAERDLDADESIRVTTTTTESLLAAARDGELRDGRTLVGLYHYALFAAP